jgi:hypothetical protein
VTGLSPGSASFGTAYPFPLIAVNLVATSTFQSGQFEPKKLKSKNWQKPFP